MSASMKGELITVVKMAVVDWVVPIGRLQSTFKT